MPFHAGFRPVFERYVFQLFFQLLNFGHFLRKRASVLVFQPFFQYGRFLFKFVALFQQTAVLMQPLFQRPVHQFVLPDTCLLFRIRRLFYLIDWQRAVFCLFDKLRNFRCQRLSGRQMLLFIFRRIVIVKRNIAVYKLFIRYIIFTIDNTGVSIARHGSDTCSLLVTTNLAF